MPRRRVAVLAGGLLAAVVVAVFGPATPAWAHAVLERSDPPAGTALDSPPDRVTLRFSEPVSVEADAVSVLDASGERADAGDASSGASSNEVTVGLRADLPQGTYVVSWRVVSADSHPISGAFAFGVGVAPDAGAAASAALDDAGSQAVGFLAGVARFVAFGGASLLLGGGFFLFVLWSRGIADRRARALLWAGWGASVAAAVGLLFLQGLYTSGLGLADIASSAPLSATLQDRFGQLLVVRLVALGLAVPLLRGVFRQPGAPAGSPPDSFPSAVAVWPRVELGALGATVAVTLATIGHAGAGDASWLASASFTVHIAAVAVWLGGLAVLAACLLRRSGGPAVEGPTADGDPGAGPTATGPTGAGPTATTTATTAPTTGRPLPQDRVAELAHVLPRWSRTAMVAVGLIVVTGLYQSWREVGTLPALVDTDYGRLLLYKVWIVVLMLGLGFMAQRWVARHYRPVVHAFASVDAPAPPAAPDPGEPSRQVRPGEMAGLRRGVLFEVALGAAILAVTAALVNAVPARTSYSPPFADTVFAGPLTVDVEVDPTRRGAQTIHVYTYGPAGRVQPLEEATAQLSLPDAGVGPLEVPMVLAAPGHATAEAVQVPLPGVWQLRLTLRISEFDQYVTTVFYDVR